MSADNNESGSTENAAYVQRQQTEAQLEAIHAHVQATQPLTGEKKPILPDLEDVFRNNDSNNNHFVAGCRYLAQHYAAYRPVRGDGNCYYRALLYRLVELLQQSSSSSSSSPSPAETGSETTDIQKEGKRLLDWIQTTSWQQVIHTGGYSEFAVETFYDTLVELFQQVLLEGSTTTGTDASSSASTTPAPSEPKDWHAALNAENDVSDYCTWYLRVLTATQLKAHADRYGPFLEDPVYQYDIAAYCQQHVEPMGRECEMVSVAALAEALQVRVVVEYLDGRPLSSSSAPNSSQQLTRHTWGPDHTKDNHPLTVYLLYRPGHYDILYPLAPEQ